IPTNFEELLERTTSETWVPASMVESQRFQEVENASNDAGFSHERYWVRSAVTAPYIASASAGVKAFITKLGETKLVDRKSVTGTPVCVRCKSKLRGGW